MSVRCLAAFEHSVMIAVLPYMAVRLPILCEHMPVHGISIRDRSAARRAMMGGAAAGVAFTHHLSAAANWA